MKDLFEYHPDRIWIKEYPIHYAGVDFNSRMTVIHLLNGNLLIHSPCEIDLNTKVAIERTRQGSVYYRAWRVSLSLCRIGTEGIPECRNVYLSRN